jgi:predicted O-methyltransferase YrrM
MTINAELIRAIYKENPYEQFPLEKFSTDLQGWGSDHYLFERIVTFLKPKLIIEVGSWKGKSAINMAKIVKKMNLQCSIICIDTWLGSIEHWQNKNNANFYDSLKIQNGYPTLYFTFLSNVINNDVKDIIVPLPMTSENGAEFLKTQNIKAELIYIDAAHEYQPVLRDLEDYWDLINDDGILLGDDYHENWPGVVKAVNDFAKNKKLKLVADTSKYVISKGENDNLKLLYPNLFN